MNTAQCVGRGRGLGGEAKRSIQGRFFSGGEAVLPPVTEKERKQIIADYVELKSYNAVAKKYNRSWHTVKKIITADPDGIRKKCEQKKEENTRDILAFMDQRKDVACDVLDRLLQGLGNETIIERSSINQIATAFGIVVDKFALVQGDSQTLSKAKELLEGVPSAID